MRSIKGVAICHADAQATPCACWAAQVSWPIASITHCSTAKRFSPDGSSLGKRLRGLAGWRRERLMIEHFNTWAFNQRPHRVLDQLRIAPIDKAPRQSIDQTNRGIALAEQQRPSIRADRPPIKGRDHPAKFHARKLQLFGVSLRRHRTLGWLMINLSSQTSVTQSSA